MIPRKGLLPRITAWGNPWHGRFQGDGLHLESGGVSPWFIPANSPDTNRVSFAGITAPITAPELVAQGGELLADAVLFTCEKRYSPASSLGIGYLGWLWRDPLGQVWRLRAEFSNNVSNPAVGSSSSMNIKVFARRFGVFGGAAAAETQLMNLSRSWTNRGPNRQVVVPHLAHSPTGARTAVTLRTGPTLHTGAPAAGNMTSRTALARAPLASALYEIQITGLSGLGTPSLSLVTIVDSAAALTESSTVTPGGTVGAINPSISLSGSTTGEPVSPGVRRDSGFEEYSVTVETVPDSTESISTRLMCGSYQGETLVPVRYCLESWRTRLDTGAAGYLGRFDWSYLYPEGTTGWENATEAQRDTSGFSYTPTRGGIIRDRHSIRLGSTEVAALDIETINRTDYSRVMPAVSDATLPDGADWFNGRVSFMTSSQVDVYERRVNGVLVASGSPVVEHDPLRASWAAAQPLIASNNVFALCPAVGGALYVDTVAASSGATATIDPPTAAGTYGELACPSFNPRTAALSIVVDGVNGYV